MLATFLVASSTLMSQKVTVLDFDHSLIEKFTSSAGLGSLLPITEEKGIISIGFAKVGIVELSSGKMLNFFDESCLDEKLKGLLQKNYPDSYHLINQTELLNSSYCQRQRYVYERFYYIEENVYACEIKCVVKDINNEDEYLSIIAFFDKELNLKTIYERELHIKKTLNLGIGGFFLNRENLYVKTAVSSPSDDYEFIHFELEDGIYKLIGEVDIIDASDQLNYFVGRHFTMVDFDDYSLLFNGSKVIKLKDGLNKDKVETIYKTKVDNELITALYKLGEQRLTGLKINVDEEGVPTYVNLFQATSSMSKIKLIKSYDQRYIRLNSMATFGKTIVLLLFDRQKEQFLIERKEMNAKI